MQADLRFTQPSPQSLWDCEYRCYEGQSGHLVYINNAEENSFIENLVKDQATSSTQVWIGGSDAHTEGANRVARARVRTLGTRET